jgi:hypothetical protein
MRSRIKTDTDIVWVPGQPGIIRASGLAELQVANPIAHPLGPPTVTGATITVDSALKSPTRVTRTLMDLTLQRFFADRVFTNAGGVTGGAVIYDELIANDLYADRDIERVVAQGQPGQMRVEQPLATEQWYEEGTQRYWTQSSVRPLMFVDNRFAVLKFQGLT